MAMRTIAHAETVAVPAGQSITVEALQHCWIEHTDPDLPTPLQLEPGDELTMNAKGPGTTFLTYYTGDVRLITKEQR